MKSKIVGIFVCMLLITTLIPIIASAGDPENPEVEDRVGDVIGYVPQQSSKKIDMVSAWVYEDSSNPDYLYISLKILDLDATIKTKITSLFTGFLSVIKEATPFMAKGTPHLMKQLLLSVFYSLIQILIKRFLRYPG